MFDVKNNFKDEEESEDDTVMERLEEDDPTTSESERFAEFYKNIGHIWVPPEVSIRNVKGGSLLTYPTIEAGPYTAGRGGTWEDVFRFVYYLREKGWNHKKKTKGLLSDFCRIAEGDSTPEDVKQFILNWGPLWYCCNDNRGDHRRPFPCTWSPDNTSCQWRPYEPVAGFVEAAKGIKAILEITEKLHRGESVPEELWAMIGISGFFASHLVKTKKPLMPRWFLTQKINDALSNLKAGILYCEWETSEKASLKFWAGWGFYRAMLVETLGLVSGGYVMKYHCDMCGSLIINRKRRPKKGQRKYCNKCRPQRYLYSTRREKKTKGTVNSRREQNNN